MTSGRIDWIAVDWGTSHLRLWLMGDGGQVLDRRHSDRGMSKLKPDEFEATLLALVGDRLPAGRRVPVICCGMAGARQGWAEAPYAAVPCLPGTWDRAARPRTSDPRLAVAILPGLSQARPADVMRGEETQIAGYLAANPGFDGVLCLPGTHCKWAHVSAGEVVSFRSFMTGELFALLSTASVLRHSVATTGEDQAAFSAALDQAMARPATVATDLFSLRAESLLQGLDPVTARARLSGLLIGIELAGARPYWLGQEVAIIGAGGLADAYATGLAAQGLSPRRTDAEAMTLAGLAAAHDALKGQL
ncbi:2-dehydro-3-deoxygalactonokinase [Paracoccus marinaquae]|uniref:2-dehydro-3-deoxygalactonokinase n=1 Tax=Paracoccus marinaquae TaxID=2841926 RepID=A0ABS6AIX1_9RHOB|nr:2-dehydro-3-deoxygalactonokinase [Paracoccus marinaquae]